jgi:probable rRNA maturation factor
LDIYVNDQQQDLKICSQSVKQVVEKLLTSESVKCDAVSICFIHADGIKSLHERYFQDPSLTDCISFPLDDEDEPYRLLGEVYVCPFTAVQYAKENGLDPYRECTLYLVHSLLHLLGYDDIDPEKETIMRQKESALIALLDSFDLSLKP